MGKSGDIFIFVGFIVVSETAYKSFNGHKTRLLGYDKAKNNNVPFVGGTFRYDKQNNCLLHSSLEDF